MASIHVRKNIHGSKSTYNGPVLEGLIDKLTLHVLLFLVKREVDLFFVKQFTIPSCKYNT